MKRNRRDFIKLGLLGVGAATLGRPAYSSAKNDELVIAYNVELPAWDPTVGLWAVNPALQGLYQSVFDQFISQKPDLSFTAGLLTNWGWNDDRSKVYMTLRQGAKWHNGSPVTAEDIVWSLERAGNEKTGNPIQFIWSKIGNFTVDENKITANVKAFEPTLFKWMAFLAGYGLPKM